MTTTRRTNTMVAAGRVLAGAAALVLAAMSFAGWSHSAAAQTGTLADDTFNLYAEGDAVQMVVSDPALPVVQTVAASPYGASASVNSVGQSQADAGAPYSPFVASLPGTVAGLGAGLIPPLPPLPGYVSTNYPQSLTNSQIQAGYALSSTSSQYSSSSKVGLGVDEPTASVADMSASAATTANPDGSVTLAATAGADLLNIDNILDLGDISTQMSMTEQPAQAPHIAVTTNVGTITLLKLTTGLTGGGLGFLGVGVPLPLSSFAGLINHLLAPLGISMTVLPQTFVYTDGTTSHGPSVTAGKQVESVDTGGLQVSITHAVPKLGVLTVTDTVGRVYASVTNGIGTGPGSGPVSPGVVPPPAPPASPATSGTPAAPAPVAATSSGAGASVPSVSPPPSAAAPVTAALPTASGPSTPNTKLNLVTRTGPSTQSVYLLMMAGVLALLAGSQLIRLLSVRLVTLL